MSLDSKIVEKRQIVQCGRYSKLLTDFFQLAYVVGISQFKFVPDNDAVRRDDVHIFKLHSTNRHRVANLTRKNFQNFKRKFLIVFMRQLLSALFHFTMLLHYILEGRRLFSSHFSYPLNNANPSIYFLILHDITKIVFRAVVVKTLWRNGSDFLEIANFLEECKQLAAFQYKHWVICTICNPYA